MAERTMQDRIDELESRRDEAIHAGSERSVARQQDKGKLLARERIDYLLDAGSFHEVDMLARHRAPAEAGLPDRPYTDGVVTGWGTVDGRKIFVYSQDFTVMGGALGEVFAEKTQKIMDLAMSVGAPIVGLNDGAGARIQEGVVALDGYGGIFRRNVAASGVIPQISVILGPCAGGAVKVLLGFLPANNLESAPFFEPQDDPNRSCDELRTIMPESSSLPYDMIKVIESVVDDGDFMEYFPHWAKSIVCGHARMGGRTVGIVANQPMILAGVLDIESSSKAARFVRTCDAFNIPLVTLIDVPGFLPGVDQEYGGIIRHGAKLLYAYCEATVPRISVVTRKAYGGAYVVMDSKSVGSDLTFAWPTAELAVMGPQGAVEIVNRRELSEFDSEAGRAERKNQLVDEYIEQYANPYIAAERGYVDEVIDPADARRKIIAGLDMLVTKREEQPRRKHGIVPL